MGRHSARRKVLFVSSSALLLMVGAWVAADRGGPEGRASDFVGFSAPAGNRPATTHAVIDGVSAAVLPNGRLVTPAGVEVNVQAPKPFGLALSPDGKTLATLNSGAAPFSLTLISQLGSPSPAVKRINVNASFMGVTFSPDSERLYLSGGENGNIWVADAVEGRIVGSINLNGPARPLDRPLDVVATPQSRFKGAFPGNMALTRDGRFLYVVDQASFQVHVIEVSRIVTGVDAQGKIMEPDNFAAVIARVEVGRYPFGIGLSPDDQTLFVTNVGVFEYTHLRPENPTGDNNVDYPLCYPGAGYPDETGDDRVIEIKKVDPRNLPDSLRDPDGIRCGYIPDDRLYSVPGLGSPNAPQSSSVYVLDVSNPQNPQRSQVVKTGPAVGQKEDGIDVYSGSHPNSVVVGTGAIFVVEDDTQNGADHIDGHRSIFLAIGPWVKKEYVSKTHISLASVFKTVNLILGLPPLNQYDAGASDLRDMFTGRPDFSPYGFQQVLFAKQVNPLWPLLTKDVDFSRPDRDEVKLAAAIMKSEGLPRRRPARELRP